MNAARLALVGLVVTAGCTQRTDLLAAADGGGGDGGAACVAPGPSIALGADPAHSCGALLAAGALERALCSCASLTLSGALTTVGGPMGPPGSGMPPAGGTVASDADLSVDGQLQVSGALEAGGAMRFGRSASALGSLRAGGAVSSMQLLTVGGDGWVGGAMAGRIDINFGLHVPPAAKLPPTVTAGMLFREPVQVTPPCGCSAGPVIDVAALLAARVQHNDNAAAAIATTALASLHGPTVFDLPCGAYYLTALQAPAPLQLRVHGRAALFVAGDVSLAGGLDVALDSGAELDLVVGGNLDAAGGTVGTTVRPAQVRLWIAGSTIALSNGAALAAELHAPAALLSSDGSLDVSGGLFVGGLEVSGDVTVRPDPHVTSVTGCAP